MSSFKCHNCGLINSLLDGDICKRCNTTYDPNAAAYRPTYTGPTNQMQPYQQPTYQQAMYNQPSINVGHVAVSGMEALLWALCCFPVGYIRFNQGGKFVLWFVISLITGGLGLIPMYIDYVMSYQAQTTRPLKPWELFPR